ncbi:Lrp/AsnC family transcriptional regulator [Cytobacillus oceanisediminis]|uniref:Lrp/AsnC family transcriptional regulator n=1 Tax=Cytobacillus oceanisediminis TaxID=665099 RepID=UPI001864E03C|nr:Lrp/AsnC family transcriptional regulator [Cytobacillus oceanisediminis]QOK28119.1 Lrp/AsnC family transcriptional regulator [Cytobacillus oceanisediminis]USK46385.1 Lrp/AsnC family transcriptional regulator [Cytobacillus oceanisediminis]
MLDYTDQRILDELSKNSRITMKELGEKVHLTGQAAASRVAKLEDQGVIEGYTIKVNQKKLGYSIHAFITVITQSMNHQPYLTFVKTQQEIIHNFKISGDGCYILECKFPSNERLDQFLTDLSKHANYKLSIVINR